MEDEEDDGLLSFLKTKRDVTELKIALEVICEFKCCESAMDYLCCPFSTWIKLEQLEDYLRLLTDRDADKVTDETALSYWEEINGRSITVSD